MVNIPRVFARTALTVAFLQVSLCIYQLTSATTTNVLSKRGGACWGLADVPCPPIQANPSSCNPVNPIGGDNCQAGAGGTMVCKTAAYIANSGKTYVEHAPAISTDPATSTSFAQGDFLYCLWTYECTSKACGVSVINGMAYWTCNRGNVVAYNDMHYDEYLVVNEDTSCDPVTFFRKPTTTMLASN